MARRRYRARRFKSPRRSIYMMIVGGFLIAAGGFSSLPQDWLASFGGGMDRATITAARIYVIDGDTIDIDGNRYRLLGFDTPETVRAQCESERARGNAATERLRALVAGGMQIELAARAQQDRYGRTLARLYVDGNDVGDVLIEEGLARRYDGGTRQGWC